jgi:hypothetical protein
VRSFLEGTGADDRGRSLEQILGHDDRWLECTHDFIQWLFPIDSPSAVNPNAPVLTALEARNLGANSKIAANMHRAFVRMAAFYGFDVKDDIIEQRSNYSVRVPNWAARPTHNDLRITRMLRSLTLFGMAGEAKHFYDVAMATVRQIRGDTQVQRYWSEALLHR